MTSKPLVEITVKDNTITSYSFYLGSDEPLRSVSTPILLDEPELSDEAIAKYIWDIQICTILIDDLKKGLEDAEAETRRACQNIIDAIENTEFSSDNYKITRLD